ncbi:uncharacterized protein PG998_001046 [Apiospora kogelbergensis]|uniref:uncharacterized protein n=1 Tax=Apiospora kogelbergensis TaxID=1337665 RepID=UPI00312FB154
MKSSGEDKTRARLRREICDVINDIGSVDNCNTSASIDKPETCTSPPELTQRLRQALVSWFSSGAAGGLNANTLVYDFGDYQSGQALTLDALSPGGEATQFHYLRSVAEELNCEVFLIKLKREDTGSENYGFNTDCMEEDDEDDEEEGDDDSENLPVRSLIMTSSDGQPEIRAMVQQNPGSRYRIDDRTWTAEVLVDWRSGFKLDDYPLEEGVIVQDEFDMDLCDDDDTTDEYDDDKEGPYEPIRYFTKRFSSTAVLVISKASLLDFLCELSLNNKRSSPVSQLVNYVAVKCHDPDHGQRHIHGLFELCTKLLAGPNQLRLLSEEAIIEALQLAIDYNHAQLFNVIGNNVAITLSPERFFNWAGHYLRNARIPLGALIPALRRSLSVTCQFSEWYTCIDRLRASEAGAPDELREFAQIALDEAAIFCWQGDVFERDGEALVLVACRFKGFDWLLNKIAPIVRGRAEDFAFAAAFCWTLYNASIQGDLPRQESFMLLKSLVAIIQESFDIMRLVSEPVYHYRRQHAYAQGTYLPPPPVSGQTLVNQLRLMITVSSDDEVRNLLSKMTEQVRLVDCRDFTGLYLPLLDDLMGLAQLHSKDLRDSPLASLAYEVVSEYWQQQNAGVGPALQTQALGRLSPMLLNCGCSICQDLHRFFVETPNVPQASFGAGVSERAGLMHLSTMIKQCTGFCGYEVEHVGLHCKWLVTKKGFLAVEQQTSRVAFARAVLGKVNQLQLSLILGETRYTSIMGTSPPLPAPSSEASPYKTSSPNNFLSHGLP